MITPSLYRQSPIAFDSTPTTRESRVGWNVARSYPQDSAPDSPRLIDLSHRPRWDYQDRCLVEKFPFGLHVPPRPGEVAVTGGLIISRMNRTQASIGSIGCGVPKDTPLDVGYTDTTDSHCWLAILGQNTPTVMECVSSLDLFLPERIMPFLTQGPVLHVPCQVVTMETDCILISFSRGYGQTFVDALLHSASDTGLQVGGEQVFTDWVAEKYGAT
jgi:hypothetical protein